MEEGHRDSCGGTEKKKLVGEGNVSEPVRGRRAQFLGRKGTGRLVGRSKHLKKKYVTGRGERPK